MKKAFTLVEMIVVIAMIAVLMAAMGSAVAKAQTRARIAKAQQETKELTNAILAYEQYAPGHTLSSVATGGGWQECNEGTLSMVLGGKKGENDERIPVLFNASLTGSRMLDPWGTPYEFMIEKTGSLAGGEDARATRFISAPLLPNLFRLSDEERSL